MAKSPSPPTRPIRLSDNLVLPPGANMPSFPRPMPLPDAPDTIKFSYDQEAAEAAQPTSGHLHWVITAFARLLEGGTMQDSTVIEVEASSEQEAIAKAMSVLVRNHYRVSSVREACSYELASSSKRLDP